MTYAFSLYHYHHSNLELPSLSQRGLNAIETDFLQSLDLMHFT